MSHSPTQERVTNELIDCLMTDEQKLTLYGTARMVDKILDKIVPTTPVENADWPVRAECDLEALSE